MLAEVGIKRALEEEEDTGKEEEEGEKKIL
jgi:hypothetical protein